MPKAVGLGQPVKSVQRPALWEGALRVYVVPQMEQLKRLTVHQAPHRGRQARVVEPRPEQHSPVLDVQLPVRAQLPAQVRARLPVRAQLPVQVAVPGVVPPLVFSLVVRPGPGFGVRAPNADS